MYTQAACHGQNKVTRRPVGGATATPRAGPLLLSIERSYFQRRNSVMNHAGYACRTCTLSTFKKCATFVSSRQSYDAVSAALELDLLTV